MPAPLVGRVFETAARAPERDALICGGERVGYGELKSRAGAAARLLERRGVRRGDRVILSARNRRPGFVYGYLACHALGAVAVPVDWGIPAPALARLAALTRARLACLDAAAEPGCPVLAMDELSSAGQGAFEPAEAGLDDAADILFTGGTTGRPKGVVLTHRNHLASARARASALGRSADDRLALPLPLSHGYGLSRLRASLLAGGAAVLVEGFLAPGDLFRAFDEHGATSLCCVPYGLAALLELGGAELGAYRSRLRFIESATAPLPPAHAARLLALLPETRLFNAYGMTETASSVAFVDLREEPGRSGSVGRAAEGVELRVVDERGASVPAGTTGRVLVRGEGVMKGYWEDPSATARALAGGWYAANDLGALDADGYLTLAGRPEELINVGGLKVAPAELENLLREHPAVADCACVGFEDPAGLSGERIKAFLVPAAGAPARPGDRELLDWLRERVESYKLPARIEWIDALPKTDLGKVLRRALR